MKSTYIDIVFEGDRFSPKRLKELTNLDIEVLAEYGEIGEKGRYKGKPIPYGLGFLKVSPSPSEDINLTIRKIIDELLFKEAALKNSGVDEITLDLENFSENEVEISIDKEIIKKISSLNASIDISNVSNFHKYFTANAFAYKGKIKPHQDIERYFLNEIYSAILAEKQLHKMISHQPSDRLSTLFAKKIDTEKRMVIGLSYTVLMTAMIVYIIKYMQEEDLDKVPSFDKVLKENYSE